MPTVADVETIAKSLGSILAGQPQTHGALTVIPILAPMQGEPEWFTLAEAGDRVRITEVDEEGSVPDLRLANLGDLPLLLQLVNFIEATTTRRVRGSPAGSRAAPRATASGSR